MGKTNITHSLQARTMKPSSCMCKTGFAQKVINLFTNAVIENSHPARLEMKPNPLARSECPDLQNCALSSSFPQLPTHKILPKPPPPLQPHFNDCAYGICHTGPKVTFNTQLRYSEAGPHLGHSRMCPAEQAPSQVCTWPSSGMPCTGGPRGRQPVILSLGGSLGLSTARGEQTQTLQVPLPLGALSASCFPKGNAWRDTHQIIHLQLHLKLAFPAFIAQQPRRARSLTFPQCSIHLSISTAPGTNSIPGLPWID